VIADSLSYHGPLSAEPYTDARLYPQVMAAELGDDVSIDLLARLGYTARDAWWALTKDPRAWGEYVGRADALLIAVGGFDQLPAAIPSVLRESLAYVRPGSLRRRVRDVYVRAAPRVMSMTDGRLRQLPQKATDHYLTRCVEGVRVFRPNIPVVALGPAPFDSALYPAQRAHAPAVLAGRGWAQNCGVTFVDLDPLVAPHLAAGRNNPDGLHWGWECHADVGRAAAQAFRAAGWT